MPTDDTAGTTTPAAGITAPAAGTRPRCRRRRAGPPARGARRRPCGRRRPPPGRRRRLHRRRRRRTSSGRSPTRRWAASRSLPAVLVTREHRRRAGGDAARRLRPRRDRHHRGRSAARCPRSASAGAVALGLVTTGRRRRARAAVELRPYAAVDDRGTADWWLVSDLGDTRTGAPLRPDHVLGVGGASITLARSTIRTDVGRLLDVGIGCGVQAVHAARHARSRHRAPTPRPRALRDGRASTGGSTRPALGGVPLDLRRGSLLEPVAGERFDLVVSNPPFVISPRTGPAGAEPTLEYRDAGFVGDTLVQRLLSGIGGVLAPGRCRAAARQLGAPGRRDVGGPRRRAGCDDGARRLGRPARGAGPGRVRRDCGCATPASTPRRTPTSCYAAWLARLRRPRRRRRSASAS